MSRKTDASSPSGGIQTATGTYTGDGAATQAIVGVGFQPRHVIIYTHTAIPLGIGALMALKTDVDGVDATSWFGGGQTFRYQADDIISLDADGFTVGDGTPFGFNRLNVAPIVYSYICFR